MSSITKKSIIIFLHENHVLVFYLASYVTGLLVLLTINDLIGGVKVGLNPYK